MIWEINLPAENPEAAAREALEIQRDPASIATVFTVIDPDLPLGVRTRRQVVALLPHLCPPPRSRTSSSA